MTTIDQTRLRRFTLSLPEPLETEFLRVFHEQSLRQIRFGFLLGCFLYGAFGLLDIVAIPGYLAPIWRIRFLIVCPALLIAFALTFLPRFQTIAQITIAAMCGFAGVGITMLSALAPVPARYLYHSGLILVLMFVFAFMRMRFIYGITMAFLLTVIDNVFTLVIAETPTWIIFNNNFFLITCMILGGFASYSIERYARNNFLQNRTIAMRTEELEEKNVELVLANQELSESKQAVVESSKRAQLIFSALADALPGTVLESKYEVGEKIGSGGFGTVYRGKHLLLDAPVAIKVFRPASGVDLDKNLDRFRLEGISAKRINHPNAVTVLDFGISASAIAFLVMELLEGHTLSDEMRIYKRLPAKRCAEVIVPLCSVLAEAHRLGIIHRDVKPGNIFLHKTQSGEVVKVVDFGIAKLLENPTASPDFENLTATGAVIGTPSYMAPERFGPATPGVSSDVYSVGVLLFEMLTGHLPFESSPGVFWNAAIMKGTAPAPSPAKLSADIPVVIDAIVRRALATRPEDRPSALEMAQTIASVYDLPLPLPHGRSKSMTLPGADESAPTDEFELRDLTLADNEDSAVTETDYGTGEK